ncbi:hypothetical protein E1A91_A05G016900v1 [Gossypium mustelinum]|uniref:Uncharacterized protein n=1 Tax=Gossypium mustelinum TaxID=34275 RepID=A0A5D2Z288_GOSMU|nr:hypothetical protein E1A91_A05G016900v1 [Gossypium mustelinum]
MAESLLLLKLESVKNQVVLLLTRKPKIPPRKTRDIQVAVWATKWAKLACGNNLLGLNLRHLPINGDTSTLSIFAIFLLF